MFFFQKWIIIQLCKLVPLWSSYRKTSECTEFGTLNTKESDVLAQNVFFSEMDHHTALKLVPLWIIRPENLRVHWVWSSKYKEKWYVNPKCVFLRNGSSYSFETCTTGIIRPENLRVHYVWSSKYKEKWYVNLKCVFSEMAHHTALKLVPLWSSDLKTSECTEFGPLTIKESDILGQKLFYFRSGWSYSFETCTIVIITPQNLRVF